MRAIERSSSGRAGAVGGWLGSELCAEIRDAGRVRPEVPFLIELAGGLVRGSIDLLAEPDGAPPTLVDFKTDRLEGADPIELAARYEVQRASTRSPPRRRPAPTPSASPGSSSSSRRRR